MKKYSAPHRMIHFVIGVSMVVLFVTGYFRMYWMGRKQISEAVSNEMTAKGIEITKESLGAISKAIINPMFEWHVYFAYIAAFAFLARIVYMLVKGIRFPNPFSKISAPKEKFQGMMYIVFYILMAITIMTGFALKFEIGTEEMRETAETVHKYAVYWLPAFVALHFAGIVIAEHTGRKGTASEMIGGE